MAKITIDGKIYEADQKKSLLHACLDLGFDIPYFCFHPGMGSVGACRQCAVKKYSHADDKKGKIVMSCMEPVAEGLIISIDDPEVKEFRRSVIEGLMENHPHDCPVCDEGGECHLQDMTWMTGHNYRKYNFRKRTYNNQYLGPFINHEMNRCIQCYRCVRFYRDYAGGEDFNVFGTANHVYFGRHQEGVLENEFSGNIIEVCPTGVFTDKTYKEHYVRKWDVTATPSVCVHCSTGCNIIVRERYGMVRRIVNRYNADVNEYFLCDRGRFGYEFLNSPERIKNIKIRPSKDKPHADSGFENYSMAAGKALKAGKIIGIGSPRASLESNFALETLVGKGNFYHGVSLKKFELVKTAAEIYKSTPALIASLKDIRESDAVLILAEDITNTAPMVALAVRQATRNKSFEMAAAQKIPLWNDYPVRELAQDIKSPVFIASPFSTKLDNVARSLYHAAPDDIARLGFMVASFINSGSPDPGKATREVTDLAKDISQTLMNARKPVVITGLTSNNEFLLNAAANISVALSMEGKKSWLSITFPESNSLGLGLMEGKPADMLKDEDIETLIVLENDLFKRIENAGSILERSRNIIVLDHLMNETAQKADIILPSGPFTESTGTIVNYEGRAQKFYRALPQSGFINDSWRFLSDMIRISGRKDTGWETVDDLTEALAVSYPVFAVIGQQDSGTRFLNDKIARQTHRFSGRTAIEANVKIHESKPPQDNDSPLAFSMEGYKGITPANLTPYFWSPGWNSINSVNKYQEEALFNKGENSFGVILFEEKGVKSSDFSKKFPGRFDPGKDKLFFVPAERIFGSEELSSQSSSVASLIPESFILLNMRYADKYTDENGQLIIKINNSDVKVNVRTDNNVPDGIGALFLRDFSWADLPVLTEKK